MACGCSRTSAKLDLSFYEFGYCTQNALKTLERGIIKAEGLHLVAGSLGMNGHYEYGGKDWIDSDFKKKNYKDAHVWIEDSEGRIYDCILPEWSSCCKFWNVKITFPRTHTTIEGMTPRELFTKYKITYKKADPETQEKIIKNLRGLD